MAGWTLDLPSSPPSTNKAVHSVFETHRLHHQKSKTGVSVAPQKRLISSKFFLKTLDLKHRWHFFFTPGGVPSRLGAQHPGGSARQNERIQPVYQPERPGPPHRLLRFRDCENEREMQWEKCVSFPGDWVRSAGQQLSVVHDAVSVRAIPVHAR